MQFQFGREKQAYKSIDGNEKKLLLVFTDNSGSVDKNRGAYRRKFYNIVLGFFNELVTSYVKSETSIAVKTYVFDAYTAQMDAYHWVGDKKQNMNFIIKYKRAPRNSTNGSSINEVYRNAIQSIDEHALTCRNFETYIMLVCDGGTEDYDGAPAVDVWQSAMKQHVSRLRCKTVTFLLAGAKDLDPASRPRLPNRKPFLQLHEEMWSRYPLARGFTIDVADSVTDIKWFVQQLNR
jgi:hypothetical protein